MGSHLSLCTGQRVAIEKYLRELNYQVIIALHDREGLCYPAIQERAPKLPLGWYELSLQDREDRKEFVSSFWKSSFAYHPKMNKIIEGFFSKVEEVGIFLVKKEGELNFEAWMSYYHSDACFYLARTPPLEEQVRRFSSTFEGLYDPCLLDFYRMHDGCIKYRRGEVLNLERIFIEKGSQKQDLAFHEECIPFYINEHQKIEGFFASMKFGPLVSFFSSDSLEMSEEPWLSWFAKFCEIFDV